MDGLQPLPIERRLKPLLKAIALYSLTALTPIGAATLLSTPTQAQQTAQQPDQAFKGHIGRTARDSTPDFPKEVRAPKGAPNVLLILMDDVGFGASSTFGGPVPTPALDRVAQAGLRYSQFHTTALCSPTRAALLSGRNHHSAATGVIMELATGFPGYNSLMPKSAGTFAEVLRQNGYNTAWYGKNHNVPDWHTSQAGPYDLWPTGLGFEYFYGFIGADTNSWAPALVEGTKPVEPPHDDPNYHLDVDMADKAIARIRLLDSMAPDKPWLTYYAPGTSHAPHHAPKEWIAKFNGQFDQGWDKVREETFARQKRLGVIPANAQLTPRPTEIQAWDSLDADRKKVYSRMMEVYAGALSHADHQIGRIIDAIEENGDLDNTLIIYIMGDNGASAEGTPQGLLNEAAVMNNIPEDFNQVLARMDELGSATTFNHFPVGWALAMDTPFQWTKQIASHFGGTRNGMAISWPARIKDKGGTRTQFHHVIDIAPTILEAAGIAFPVELNGVPQKPIEGVSMAYSFDNAQVPSTHRTQYFEMLGNRAIYNDGWVAATTPAVAPWVMGRSPDIDAYHWELYNVGEDFSEAVNLADREPKKLREMQDLFWVEAAKYNFLPLDNSKLERFDVRIRPSLTRGRSVFTYYDGQSRIPEGAAPDLKNKSFKLTAYVDIPAENANGVMATQGGRFNGWGFYLLDGRPVFHYNLAGVRRFTISGNERLAPGRHVVLADFKYDGGGLGKGGTVTISVDGKEVAKGRVEQTYAFRVSLDETLDIGEDTGTPVSEDYRVPFNFSGKLNRVLIQLSDSPLTAADEEQIRRAKAAVTLAQ